MANPEELEDLMDKLREFQKLDQFMSVTTALTLLEIILADQDGELVSTDDLQVKLDLKSSAASRLAKYWAEGHPHMTKSHNFIRIDLHPADSRKRSYTLTPRGKLFLKKLFGNK